MSLKLQGSFVSGQWRMMQNLQRNWLASSKLTWGIWRIFTRALEHSSTLIECFWPKYIMFELKRSIEELCLIALNINAKFEKKKLICDFKNDMRNLKNFDQRTFESLKIGLLMGSFYPKQKMYELKIYRGVLYHENKEWYKSWRGIDLSVQNWHEEFD